MMVPEKFEFKPGVRRMPPELMVKVPTEEPAKKKTPTYNMTMEQIQNIKKAAVDEAIEAAWTLMLGLPVMVLSDKNGFTNEELDKFVDDVMALHDSYDKGYLTLADIHFALKDEAGVSIIGKRKKWRKAK